MVIFKSVSIEGFRSIERAQGVPLGPITVVVGPNNSGKSSLLHAIYALQEQQLTMDGLRLGRSVCTVTMELEGLPQSLRAMGDEPIPEDFKDGSLTLSVAKNPASRSLTLTPNPLTSTNRVQMQVDNPVNSEPRNLIYPVLSRRRARPPQEMQVTSEQSRMIQDGDSNLVARVHKLQGNTIPQAKRFTELCQNVLGFELEVIESTHNQTLGTRVDINDHIPLSSMGAGLSSTLSLLAGLAVAKGKLFLIEEPENDLHPLALKKLLREIVDASAENQFIISTHSSIVLSQLAKESEAVVLEVENNPIEDGGKSLPTSTFRVVSDSVERIALLKLLGYSPVDIEMSEAWLIVEESSATSLFRWLIQWFVPRLANTRLVAAGGVTRVQPLFQDFKEMFLYAHLESYYQGRAWVLVDGDESGREAIDKLTRNFPSWDGSHFHAWNNGNIEEYYPSRFRAEVEFALGQKDKKVKREEKCKLTISVQDWIVKNQELAREEFKVSASEIIEKLNEIASCLNADSVE
jgi:predicted ATPase